MQHRADCRVSPDGYPQQVAHNAVRCVRISATSFLAIFLLTRTVSDVMANLAVAIQIVTNCTKSCCRWCALPTIAPSLNALWFCRVAVRIQFQSTDAIRRIRSIPPTTTLR